MPIHEFRTKMEAAGVSEPAIRAFERSYAQLADATCGQIPESSIQPVESLPSLAEISATLTPQPALLNETAVLKLNGGLGTGMGLERAKSLLPVHDGLTFLDLIVRQILRFRKTSGHMRFLTMNSFSTSADTRAALAKYPDLGDPAAIELLQNKTPKIDAQTLRPVVWEKDRELEWCPPGHGDLYAVLATGGTLERLLADGIRYLFVSNSDNLGATLDLALLTWFAESGAPFMMEVTARTPSDRKGGHLARRGHQLLLRESAQCPEADMDAFQDITRHRFFNTNNLWIRLERLRDALAASDGSLPLPLIRNKKTVDPRDKNSPEVFQLETAMGAAIECFADARAVDVPRSRFAPVKTTADLLTLRSDAYDIRPDGTVALAPELGEIPPHVELDHHYKMVDQLEAALAAGTPSLKGCRTLKVKGPVLFNADAIFQGEVTVENPTHSPLPVPPGIHFNTHLIL
ncbi:MAG: UTP--glucose-1-phosphate uridylyltransferase [Chthoniobacter sp.]|nr:UTP--glucose-1-phosphate uridylyltransferase [Chthoniobacter sp.]